MPMTTGGLRPCARAACPLSRRALLRTAALSVGAPVLALLPACGAAPPAPPASLTLPLDTLPLGHRIVVKVGAVPVEVMRTAAGATARSLVCTHQGCTVAWVEEKQRYKCPCQDAWFDAEGQPVTGPVSQPLASLPAPVSNGSVTLTEPTLAVPAKRG